MQKFRSIVKAVLKPALKLWYRIAHRRVARGYRRSLGVSQEEANLLADAFLRRGIANINPTREE